jgi:hypothetical protein
MFLKCQGFRLRYKHIFEEEPAMRVVHVGVSQADFAEIFEAMATWLERNNRPIEHFGTEVGDGGSIIIKAQFDGDDLAERFRREFRGDYGD